MVNQRQGKETASSTYDKKFDIQTMQKLSICNNQFDENQMGEK
jgi:hypothetical protein